MKPKALIIDDERLMRDQVRDALTKAWPELEITGEAANGIDAITAIEAHQPDIIFLDIRMPGMTGLEVAALVADRVHIVFVTAYDQHAIEAFERGAVDYLLKPVDDERLEVTVARLKQRLTGGKASGPANVQPELAELIAQLAQKLHPNLGKPQLRWIKATIGGNLRLIPVEEVVYFQADDKYTRVFTAQSEALIRSPIKELTEELDSDRFWKIHRATIVNASEIAGVARDVRDRLMVALKSRSEKLEVSRSFTHLFKQM
ncbi:MAG: DNA-binding response regulator [Betaproteobacteria bacterium]|nr:MAG: DNA-binding response regulator [Betaproteobacteria bacterium]